MKLSFWTISQILNWWMYGEISERQKLSSPMACLRPLRRQEQVLRPPDVPRIGVGEATVPTLKGTLKTLGISEAEFMQRTEATFKLGIWFKNWNKDDDGNFIEFVHPFTGGLTA